MTLISVPFFMGDPMTGLESPRPHLLLDPPLPADASPQERMAVLYAHLADLVAARDRPTVYAGDCVATIGVLAGLQRRQVAPTLVFLDAHGDFNTWETTPSGFIGGMPLAMVTGRGEQTIVAGVGLAVLADNRVLLADARDLDPGEAEAISASGIQVTSIAALIADELPTGPLYVHVDGDVVDPRDMPAMNYPAAGGPSLASVVQVVKRLHDTGRVVAFSVSSWNPALPGAPIAAEAMRAIAAPFLPETGDPPSSRFS